MGFTSVQNQSHYHLASWQIGWNNYVEKEVQIMPWCRPGNKPLSEPMLVIILMHIYASLGLSELITVFSRNMLTVDIPLLTHEDKPGVVKYGWAMGAPREFKDRCMLCLLYHCCAVYNIVLNHFIIRHTNASLMQDCSNCSLVLSHRFYYMESSCSQFQRLGSKMVLWLSYLYTVGRHYESTQLDMTWYYLQHCSNCL